MNKLILLVVLLIGSINGLTISDNFNRADAALRSGNYVDGAFYAVIHSNAVASNNNGNVSYSLWKNNQFGANQFMRVTVDTLMVLSDNYCKMVICADSSVQNSGYHTLIRYYGLQIYARWSNVKIGEYLKLLNRNDTISTYTYGDSIYTSVNRAIVFRAFNDSLRGVKIGIGGRVGSTQDYSRVDNMVAGDFDGTLDYDTNELGPFNIITPPIIDSVKGVSLRIDTINTVDTIAVYGLDFKSSGTSIFINTTETTILTQNDTIITVAVNTSDTGSAQIYVTDSAGNTASRGIYLIQLGLPPPQITSSPHDTSFFTGGVYSSSVTATGDSLSYQWYVNGSTYGTDTNIITTSALDTTYDSSLVWCIVSNSGGADTSDTAVIRVYQTFTVDSVGIYRGVLLKGSFPYTVDSVKIDGMDGTDLIQTGDSIVEFTPPFALMWQRDAFVVTLYSNGLPQSIDLYFDKNRISTGNNKQRVSVDLGL